MSAKKDKLIALEQEFEELYLLDKNLAQLKEARAKQAKKVITQMKRMRTTHLIGHRFIGEIQAQGSMRFVGGMKKFIKAFGRIEADKWFKRYSYESIKVVKKS